MVRRSLPRAARNGVPRPQLVLPPLRRARPTTRRRRPRATIWRTINGVNLRENIQPTRERAQLVLEKGADHAVTRMRLRRRKKTTKVTKNGSSTMKNMKCMKNLLSSDCPRNKDSTHFMFFMVEAELRAFGSALRNARARSWPLAGPRGGRPLRRFLTATSVSRTAADLTARLIDRDERQIPGQRGAVSVSENTSTSTSSDV